jgi:hypothetical protein
MDSFAFEVLVMPACRGILLGMARGGLVLQILTLLELLIEWAELPLGSPTAGPCAVSGTSLWRWGASESSRPHRWYRRDVGQKRLHNLIAH